MLISQSMILEMVHQSKPLTEGHGADLYLEDKIEQSHPEGQAGIILLDQADLVPTLLEERVDPGPHLVILRGVLVADIPEVDHEIAPGLLEGRESPAALALGVAPETEMEGIPAVVPGHVTDTLGNLAPTAGIGLESEGCIEDHTHVLDHVLVRGGGIIVPVLEIDSVKLLTRCTSCFHVGVGNRLIILRNLLCVWVCMGVLKRQ